MSEICVIECRTAGCSLPASMACPTCVRLGVTPMHRFCTQECFKKSWDEVRAEILTHTLYLTPLTSYVFTTLSSLAPLTRHTRLHTSHGFHVFTTPAPRTSYLTPFPHSSLTITTYILSTKLYTRGTPCQKSSKASTSLAHSEHTRRVR